MALTHRVERIQEQVREEVSQMLATEVRDPGVGLVTVTRTKVTGDLSLARIYWTIIGDAAERKKTAKALERATGFVRHLLAERLALRRVPEVKFIFDESVAAQDRIEQIIQEIHAEEAARTVASPASAEASARLAEARQDDGVRRRPDFVDTPAPPPTEAPAADAPKHGEPK